MSLKSFHIAFITVSTTLCLFLALWGFNGYHANADGQSLGLGITGVAGLLALIPYYFWFRKKSQKLLLAFLLGLPLWLLNSPQAWSCAVCFGDSNTAMTKGIKAGIILLILVVGGVLGGILAVGLTWAKKARQIESL